MQRSCRAKKTHRTWRRREYTLLLIYSMSSLEIVCLPLRIELLYNHVFFLFPLPDASVPLTPQKWGWESSALEDGPGLVAFAGPNIGGQSTLRCSRSREGPGVQKMLQCTDGRIWDPVGADF